MVTIKFALSNIIWEENKANLFKIRNEDKKLDATSSISKRDDDDELHWLWKRNTVSTNLLTVLYDVTCLKISSLFRDWALSWISRSPAAII